MVLAQSKVTAQVKYRCQRRCDGNSYRPSSVFEWDEEGDAVVVRKAGQHTSEDIHRAIFPHGTPASKKIEEFDQSVRRYMKKKTCAPLIVTFLVRLVTRDNRRQVAAAESFVSKGA
jgi:hypothetical protein